METLPPDVRIFLEYDYAQTIRILGTFITLVSATLVLSLTFWEKIIAGHEGILWVRWAMLLAWGLFFFAVLGGVMSMVMMSAASGCALYGEAYFLVGRLPCTHRPVAEFSWAFSAGSGFAYALGLMFLSLAAGRCVWPKNGEKP